MTNASSTPPSTASTSHSETTMSFTSDTQSGLGIPGTRSHFLDPTGADGQLQGRLRYLTGGTGAPLVLLHTVRTQAEHFRHLVPLSRSDTPCTPLIFQEWATPRSSPAPPTRSPPCATP
jgi:hypothetical protein